MNDILFPIPKGMKHKDVAECLTAYLLGASAFGNTTMGENKPWRLGPSWDEGSSKWRLDNSNNYWLHVNTKTNIVTLSARYSLDVPEAMVALFTAQFNKGTG
jgi:hypothetical protein